jgi:tRNA(fMet)-specific endonuclease VapC
VAYLFDTDAISEIWRPRPAPAYLDWLSTLHREEQFTSAVTLGELYRGAYRSQAKDKYLVLIDQRTLPLFTVLPYDADVAKVYGQCRAAMEALGNIVAEPDLQIAATALHFGLTVVTGNVRHFSKVPKLSINAVLYEAKQRP